MTATHGRTTATQDGGAARDGGSGSVLVLGILAVVVVLGGSLGVLGAAQGARSAAQTAADLGALAAADAIAAPWGVTVAAGTGPSEPCAVASAVVARNRARLTRCVLLPDGVVEVRTARAAPTGAARAVARAGPADAGAPGRPL